MFQSGDIGVIDGQAKTELSENYDNTVPALSNDLAFLHSLHHLL